MAKVKSDKPKSGLEKVEVKIPRPDPVSEVSEQSEVGPGENRDLEMHPKFAKFKHGGK